MPRRRVPPGSLLSPHPAAAIHSWPIPTSPRPFGRQVSIGSIARPMREARALRGALFAFAVLFAALVGGTALAALVGAVEPAVPITAALCFALIAALAVRFLPLHPHPRFGPANVVTALRAALAALMTGLVWDAERLSAGASPAFGWTVAGLATVALLLDGIDGAAARRAGTASRYGELFDMETDAFLILVLSVLVVLGGKADAYVLLLGLMRYLFVGLRRIFPDLRRPLPPSFRRKAVCVLQVAVLGALLTPVVAEPFAEPLAAFALVCLTASFAVDLRWLAVRGTGGR